MKITAEELRKLSNRHTTEVENFITYVLGSFPNIVIEQSAADIREFFASRAAQYSKDYDTDPELARVNLYAGYLESPVEYVKETLYSMGHEISVYDAYDYYEQCKDIFERYPFGDYFVGSPKELEMSAEIKERLSGMQILKTDIDNHLVHLYRLLSGHDIQTDVIDLTDTYKKVREIYQKYRTKGGIDDFDNWGDRDRLQYALLMAVTAEQ